MALSEEDKKRVLAMLDQMEREKKYPDYSKSIDNKLRKKIFKTAFGS